MGQHGLMRMIEPDQVIMTQKSGKFSLFAREQIAYERPGLGDVMLVAADTPLLFCWARRSGKNEYDAADLTGDEPNGVTSMGCLQ